MFFSEISNRVYVIWAFTFQFVLVVFFALRKLHFALAVKYGWIVYALSLVGLLVSIQLGFPRFSGQEKCQDRVH